MMYTRKAKDFAAARTVKIVKRKRTPDEISRETKPVSLLITTFRCLSICYQNSLFAAVATFFFSLGTRRIMNLADKKYFVQVGSTP